VPNRDVIDMEIVKEIESSGNPKAFNKASGCRGLYQISEICFKEFGQFHPAHNWTLDDLFNPAVNTFIARWYMLWRLPAMFKSWKIYPTTAVILAAYNWGPGNARGWCKKGGSIGDLPQETRAYINKYLRLEEEKNA